MQHCFGDCRESSLPSFPSLVGPAECPIPGSLTRQPTGTSPLFLLQLRVCVSAWLHDLAASQHLLVVSGPHLTCTISGLTGTLAPAPGQISEKCGTSNVVQLTTGGHFRSQAVAQSARTQRATVWSRKSCPLVLVERIVLSPAPVCLFMANPLTCVPPSLLWVLPEGWGIHLVPTGTERLFMNKQGHLGAWLGSPYNGLWVSWFVPCSSLPSLFQQILPGHVSCA